MKISRVAVVAATFLVSACGGQEDATAPTKTAEPVEVVAVGDIARCESQNDEATAKLAAAAPDATVLALGDIAYHNGLEEEFEGCYAPSWGKFRQRTRPVPGNHEYGQFESDAAPYFNYFGRRAGEYGKGYYSFDLGAWHFVALNSNCGAAVLGGCGPDSPQVRWLRDDLDRSAKPCTVAYWHHPRFSSGTRHGSDPAVAPFWDVLYEAGVELVLNGHEHNYQRFAPQAPSGEGDSSRGIREFVVGTGGGESYPTGPALPTTEAQHAGTLGVLRLTLGDGRYDWKFEPAAEDGFTDAGSGTCH